MYINGKTESGIKLYINNLKNEIKIRKIFGNIKERAKETIINQLRNLKDENKDKIYNEYSYEYTYKENGIMISILFIKITKNILKNLLNREIEKYFWDVTYHCIPPTIKNYNIFLISGFNLKDKKIYMISYFQF